MLQILATAVNAAGYEFSSAWYVGARQSQVALHGMQTLFVSPPPRGEGRLIK